MTLKKLFHSLKHFEICISSPCRECKSSHQYVYIRIIQENKGTAGIPQQIQAQLCTGGEDNIHPTPPFQGKWQVSVAGKK